MNTLKVMIPEDVYSALKTEASRVGMSIDAIASVFLYDAVTHTKALELKSEGEK